MSRKSDYDIAIREWYCEPPWVTDLLLAAEFFPARIWDPAAGMGTIVERAREAGYVAHGTDISPQALGVERFDFMTADYDSEHFHLADTALICNPPYSQAEAFIRKAIEIGVEKHAWFVQRDFPYSQRRCRLFEQYPPARIWFLSSRPSCPPGDALRRGEVEAKGGSADYLWMVWDSRDAEKHPVMRGAHYMCQATHCGWLIRPEHLP